ncbi:hypothetical protein [Arenicella xantha]|uniref:Uncharacterized protein n=1 Tax=Arenicella xantha TaxID=644221 RepID=A0A395JHC0_9GAMM|nr:hypothetical protein [Arenicella xantha]RBP49357.1 hypothetical protein DFR28_104288 [Arenicella xantha]
MEAQISIYIEKRSEHREFFKKLASVLEGVTIGGCGIGELKGLEVNCSDSGSSAVDHFISKNPNISDDFSFEGYIEDEEVLGAVFIGGNASQLILLDLLKLFKNCGVLTIRAFLKQDEAEIISAIKAGELIFRHFPTEVDRDFVDWWQRENSILKAKLSESLGIEDLNHDSFSEDEYDDEYEVQRPTADEVEKQIDEMVSNSAQICPRLYGTWELDVKLTLTEFLNTADERWQNSSNADRQFWKGCKDNMIEWASESIRSKSIDHTLKITQDGISHYTDYKYVIDSIDANEVKLRTLKYSLLELKQDDWIVTFIQDSLIKLVTGNGKKSTVKFFSKSAWL